jgi:hypothetical protein
VIYNSFKDKEFQMFLRGIYPQKSEWYGCNR